MDCCNRRIGRDADRTLQDLCGAALSFAFDILRPGGRFICKFYQGGEDKRLEHQLKSLFLKVHREKPESSRSVGIHYPPRSVPDAQLTRNQKRPTL